jgi:hypothetical protein
VKKIAFTGAAAIAVVATAVGVFTLTGSNADAPAPAPKATAPPTATASPTQSAGTTADGKPIYDTKSGVPAAVQDVAFTFTTLAVSDCNRLNAKVTPADSVATLVTTDLYKDLKKDPAGTFFTAVGVKYADPCTDGGVTFANTTAQAAGDDWVFTTTGTVTLVGVRADGLDGRFTVTQGFTYRIVHADTRSGYAIAGVTSTKATAKAGR